MVCPSNCSDCSKGYCVSCNSGYYLNYNNGYCPACSTAVANCATCTSKTTGGATCTKCNSGYYLNGSSCTACPSNATCTGTSTFTCKSGYTKSGSSCVISATLPDLPIVNTGCPANTQDCGSTGCCPTTNSCSYYAQQAVSGGYMCLQTREAEQLEAIDPGVAIR